MSSIEDHHDDAKFPGQIHTGLPPSPTIENPGGVFPKSDPAKASLRAPLSHHNSGLYIGNPFLMNEAFSKLDRALGEVIDILEQEERAVGADNVLMRQFLGWRDQLDTIRTGKKTPARSPVGRASPEREGGLFVD